MNDNAKRIVGWIFAGFLGLLFLFSGISKVFAAPEVIANYEVWGLPTWFMLTVGIIEILGAIAILIPKIRSMAAFGLITLMLGAIVIHIMSNEFSSIIVNLGIIGVSIMLIYFNKLDKP